MARVYNCTDSPVDLGDGKFVDGREFAETNLTAVVKQHIEDGRLAKVADQEKSDAAPANTKEK